MAHIDVFQELDLESPTLVEGLPGVGLVGKIATDHLVRTLDMTYYGACYCDGIPQIAVYQEDDYRYQPPVRLYADESRDLLALQSDIPISPERATEFTGCLVDWFDANDVTPICLSGLPEEKDGAPELYGIGAGGIGSRLEALEIEPPQGRGLVSGPTGAILSDINERGIPGVGLIVQANQRFPDPEAARILLIDGIGPFASIDVDTESLVDQAEEITKAREELAQRMQQASEESSQAQPLGMYQ